MFAIERARGIGPLDNEIRCDRPTDGEPLMKLLHTAVLGLALATSPIVTTAGADAPASRADRVEVHVTVPTDVGADGRVTAVMFDDDVPTPLRPLLEREIRRWEFEPARRGDMALPSRTFLKIGLRRDAIGAGGDPLMRIARVSNGPASVYTAPPRYSPDALRHMVSGRVDLRVSFGPDGHVTNAVAENVDTDKGRRGAALLTDAAIEGVRQWRFAPEQIDGQPIGGSITTPVSFCLSIGRKAKPCRYSLKHEQQPFELIAIAPATRLLTDVIGRTL